jgi:hypothetical protein
MQSPSSHRLALGIIMLLQLAVILPVLSYTITEDTPSSCTIFTVSRDGSTFFCNNEDEGLRHGRVWFLPESQDEYGIVLFGYGIYRNLMVPVGGMNAEGLCVDGTMVDETEVLLDPSKPDCPGSYFIDMLRQCATVAEAKDWLRSYDLPLLYWQQGHIADRNGDAVVVGLDLNGALWMTNKSEDYMITVNNVNPAQGDDPYHSWRYDTASSMLDSMGTPSVELCAEVLEAVQLSSTMFSYIGNLPNRLLYLYSRADYDRVATLNVTEELSKEAHSYDIERLVSQQSGLPSPADTPAEIAGMALAASVITCSILIAVVKLRRQEG